MTTANKGLNQPAYNTYNNTWGTGPLNDNFGYIDLALGGSTLLNATGLGGTTVTLTSSQCVPLTISVTGAPGGIVTYTVPAGIGGQWVVRNGTTGGYAIRIQSAAGGSYISIGAGINGLVSCDGTATGMVASISAPPAAGGSSTQVQYNNSGVLAGSAGMTFDGTTFSVTGFSNTGNTVLGDASGDTLTINCNTASIPNTLNIGSSTVYLNGTTKQVGIGTTSVGSNTLTVAGTIASNSGGFVFPDATVQTTAGIVPSGVMVPYAGASAPVGWLICGGQAVSRTTYAALYAVIGTTYGAGNGTTTFNLPDIRGRVAAGLDNMGGTAANRLTSATMTPDGVTLGATGGSETNTSTTNSTGTTSGSLSFTTSTATGGTTVYASGGGGAATGYDHYHTGNATGSLTVSASGTSGAFSVVQPTILFNYIIKT